MGRGNFLFKLNYLCFDIKRIEDFLIFSKDTSPQSWCVEGEGHSPHWCETACSNINWVFSLLMKFSKSTPNQAKIAFFR